MIRLEKITKIYQTRMGSRTVLKQVDLSIYPRQKVGILGCNGAGKSTLIRIISGAERPTSGRVHRGMKVSWPLAFSGGFQGSLTGLDNLQFICRVYGANFKVARPYVEDFSELGSYLREPIKTYSSGMRARLAFAISMAVDFDCFFVDEIVAVGDSRFQEKCRVELFEKRRDRALILVSHQSSTIRAVCESAVVLAGGKLYEFDSMDEAFDYHECIMALR